MSKDETLLPVTQADRDAFREICLRGDSGLNVREMLNSGAWDADYRMQELIRHRISHSLPGDVGMREALKKAAVRFEVCAGMISGGHNISGTRRAEQTIKSKHFAAEALAALTPSALSGDAGEGELGRFGHHPDPAIDFCHEVECCENDAYDLRASTRYTDRRQLLVRIDRAMSFRVGGDEGCVSAKQRLRELERAILDGDCREYIDGLIAARAVIPPQQGAGEP